MSMGPMRGDLSVENNKKPESNHLYHKGDKGTLRAMLILFLGPMPIYLSLIIVVMVWPEILNALGLQGFVHYVTYDLQRDAHLNLLRAFPRCPPEFEVYFFHMQAASMLIIVRWSHIVGQSGSEVKVYPVV